MRKFFVLLLFLGIVGCNGTVPSGPAEERVSCVEGAFDSLSYDSSSYRWTISWTPNDCVGAIVYIRASGVSTWIEYPYEKSFHFEYGAAVLVDKDEAMSKMPWVYRIVFIY